MSKSKLISLMTFGLALATIRVVFAATPGVLNPTPNRESKLVADFEAAADVTSDPNGTGENRASIDADPQFAANGAKSLKIDMTGVTGGWHDHEFTIKFAPPVDIKGYLVLAMDVYVPDSSLADPSSYYNLDPRTTTTSPTDATISVTTAYLNRNVHPGWNHLVWNLQEGTDTQLSQLDFSGNSGADYSGPLYVDNIRVYKGNFAGLQPDEKLIFGFDKPADKHLFTVGDAAGVAVNTDRKFISQGDGSLAIDLKDQAGSWTSNVVTADDWGPTLDASNASAIHLDVFIPADSAPANNNWHQLGYTVIGDGGEVAGDNSGGIVDGQWNTVEIPLTAEQAAMLKNVKGIRFIRNQGDAWRGPIYVDALRAAFPTANGGATPGP